jgi:hypothetical protein
MTDILLAIIVVELFFIWAQRSNSILKAFLHNLPYEIGLRWRLLREMARRK